MTHDCPIYFFRKYDFFCFTFGRIFPEYAGGAVLEAT